jgi:hypothetical protein
MKIIGFGQQMMLRGAGVIQHEISVELDDGSVHIIPTDEKTVQTLIGLYSGPSKSAGRVPVENVASEQAPSRLVYQEPDEVEQMMEFGGDEEGDPGEMVPAPRMRPRFLDDDDGRQV